MVLIVIKDILLHNILKQSAIMALVLYIDIALDL